MKTFTPEERADEPIYVLWLDLEKEIVRTLSPRDRATSVTIRSLGGGDREKAVGRLRDDDDEVFDSLLGPVEKVSLHHANVEVLGAFAPTKDGQTTGGDLIGGIAATKTAFTQLHGRTQLVSIFLAKTFRHTAVLGEMLRLVPAWIAEVRASGGAESEKGEKDIDGIVVSIDAYTLKADYNPVMSALAEMGFHFWGVLTPKGAPPSTPRPTIPANYHVLHVMSNVGITMWRARLGNEAGLFAGAKVEAKEWPLDTAFTTSMKLANLRTSVENAKPTLRQTEWIKGFHGALPQHEGSAVIEAYVMVKDQKNTEFDHRVKELVTKLRPT